VDSNRVVLPANIAKPDRQETWPGWSPDGRHLYFCSAPKLPQERFREVRYDLMRIGYNIETDQWGEPETLVSAAATGLSAAQPKVSPDGKYLLFCLFKHGNFPIYQASSDLYLLDLKTLKFRRLEINSDQADSWHCWSSNSRWVVFSSKRRDGLFARPYFSHVDEAGQFSKPFLLPQKDPAFYDSFIKTYNVPEFVQGPIRLSPQQLAEAIVKPRKVLRPPPIGSQVQKQEVEYERPKPRN
jgi:Tol biopolymer transport system component